MSVSTVGGSMLPPERRKRVLEIAPMMPAAVAMSAGVVIDRFFWNGATTVWIGITAVAIVLAAVEYALLRRLLFAILVAWCGIGGAWHHARWFDRPADDISRRFGPRDAGSPAWIKGVIVDTPIYRPDPERPDSDGSTRTILAVTGLSDGQTWSASSGRVAVWIGGDRTDLKPGRPVQIAGAISPIDGPHNPGERDTRAWWRADGVRLRMVAGSESGIWSDLDGQTWRWTYALGQMREWSYRRLVASLNQNVAPLAAALLLGRREMVDPELNDAFARTGTTHLLAISGLHMQVLAWLLWGVCRFLGVGRRRTMMTVIICSIAYAVLVGLAPSVVRSLAMTLVVCVAGLLDRRHRFANQLAVAVVVTLALNPAHLFDAGCQLSFLAVAAIVWIVPIVDRALRWRTSQLDEVERAFQSPWRRKVGALLNNLRTSIVLSIVVWAVALPLVSHQFHLSSPVSVLLNLPLVPITSMAMLLAGLTLILAAIWPPLSLATAIECRWLLSLTDAFVMWGAKQKWAYAFGPGPGLPLVCTFYLVLAVAAVFTLNPWPRWLRRGSWGAVIVCAMIMLVRPWFPHRIDAPHAEVLSVGHGLAVVVQSTNGHVLLYDCGRMGDPRVGRRIIAPALWDLGISRIDTVVLSHADSDHYNGLPDLLDRFSIGEIVVTPNFVGAQNPDAEKLLRAIAHARIPIRKAVESDRWTLGSDVHITVLHPPSDFPKNTTDNARSLVLDIEARGRHLVLTGDLEASGLTSLIEQPQLPIDVFLSPHHGGRASNPSSLYVWALAKTVVSSQRKPTDGTRDALEMLEKEDTPVFRTWKNGAIRLRWSVAGIEATPFLDPNLSDTELPDGP